MSSNSTIPVMNMQASSLDGVLIWLTILAVLGLFSVALYEMLRRNSKLAMVYYTRIYDAKTQNDKLLYPGGLFEWIKSVICTPEDVVLEHVGLDAVMYLRYLRMCFKIFGIVLVFIFLVLLPLNYFVNHPTEELGIVRPDSLKFFSISEIENGSRLLWVHVLCTYFVSIVAYKLLYNGYRKYTVTVSKILKQPKTNHVADLNQRTVLISNLPPELRTESELEAWFLKINIGLVDEINMNIPQDQILLKKMRLFEREQRKLERAYMVWAMNIYKTLLWGAAGKLVHLSPQQRMMLCENQMSRKDREMAEKIAKSCRPIVIQHLKQVDVISFLSNETAKLEEEIIQKRNSVIETTTELAENTEQKGAIRKLYRQYKTKSVSAFVTFKEIRSAYMATQLLLYPSMDGITMTITPASSPSELQWDSLTSSALEKKIKSGLLSFTSLTISFLWVMPTYLISQLTVTGLSDPKWVDIWRSIPGAAIVIRKILPPVLILTCNNLMPFFLEFLSYLQGHFTIADIEEATLLKYFYFLMFNVNFVFTFLSSAWYSSERLFDHPFLWVESISTSFPGGASLFTNYLILSLIMFPVELLRPWPIIYYLFSRMSAITPRELTELSIGTSMLQYSYMYPIHILVFIIVICYSVISPLVLLPGTVYFACAWIVHKNQLLYVYVKKHEFNGKFWLLAYRRSVFGLGLFQFLTAGLISAKNNHLAALTCGLLIPCTYIFYQYGQACFAKQDTIIPLQDMPTKRLASRHQKGTSNLRKMSISVSNLAESQPSLSPTITESGKLSSHEQYKNPAQYQLLSQLWIPQYISHLVETSLEPITEVDTHIVSIKNQSSWLSMQQL
ncbi:hypothetical protein BC833DRAFT_580558, partial [Globomyces pollinis-pini]